MAGESIAAGSRCRSTALGNVVVGLQPARGYNIDPTETYHSPDLVPPHNYLAFYFWLREHWGAHAIVHMGKHGNLEWLPGKALALSETCLPEAVLGPMPHVYPFIVNDPGEGTQAKRRAQAVIVDHLTPPLTRAESYGPLRDLEALVDEYYEAAGVDPRRLAHLRARDPVAERRPPASTEDAGHVGRTRRRSGAARRLSLRAEGGADPRRAACLRPVARRAGWSATWRMALLRVPRGDGTRRQCLAAARAGARIWRWASTRSTATWPRPGPAPRPARLAELTPDRWRSAGDTVERLELLSAAPARRRRRRPARPAPRCWTGPHAGCAPALARLRPGGRVGASHRPRGAVRRPGAVRRADARAARRAADRAQLLLGRQPRGADAGRLGAGLEIGQPADRGASADARATGRGRCC